LGLVVLGCWGVGCCFFCWFVLVFLGVWLLWGGWLVGALGGGFQIGVSCFGWRRCVLFRLMVVVAWVCVILYWEMVWVLGSGFVETILVLDWGLGGVYVCMLCRGGVKFLGSA